jgi:hypothetical protein
MRGWQRAPECKLPEQCGVRSNAIYYLARRFQKSLFCASSKTGCNAEMKGSRGLRISSLLSERRARNATTKAAVWVRVVPYEQQQPSNDSVTVTTIIK